MRWSPVHRAGRIVFYYLLLASLWILCSDWALRRYAPASSSLQTWKGQVFVLVTGSLLFVVLRRELEQRRQVEERLRQAFRREEAMGRIRGRILALQTMDEFSYELEEEWVDELRRLDLPVFRVSLQFSAQHEGNFTTSPSILGQQMPPLEVLLADYPWVKEAWDSGRPVVVDRARLARAGFQPEVKSLVEVPLPDGGSLGVNSQVEGAFSEEAVHTLQHFAGLVATALRRLQDLERVRQNWERYRLLIEQSPYAIGVHQDGRIVFVNPAAVRLFGASSAEELTGSPIRNHVHPETWDAAHARIERMLRGETGLYPTEDRYLRLDGSAVPVEVIAAPFIHEGRPAVQVIALDITERKKMAEELSTSQAQLRALYLHLQEVREDERKEISREIHDELGQALTALKMDLAFLQRQGLDQVVGGMERLRGMRELLDSTITRVQRLSASLRPGSLDDLGLRAAMEWQAEEFSLRTEIPCTLEFQPEEITLDPDRSLVLFRIFQEALTNVFRHAEARQVWAGLEGQTHRVMLTVRDDGRGIAPEEASSPRALGLLGMRERLEAWNGHLQIVGRPGQGTTLKACLSLVGGGCDDPGTDR